MDLFTREPVDLTGYTPVFSNPEVLFGHKYREIRRNQQFRWNMYGDEDERNGEEVVAHEHTIKVLNHTLTTDRAYFEHTAFGVVAILLRDFLAAYQTPTRTPAHFTPTMIEAAEWLKANASQLENDIRYWATEYEFRRIANKKAKLAALAKEIENDERRNSINSLEVHERRKFSINERRRLDIEFGGTQDNT